MRVIFFFFNMRISYGMVFPCFNQLVVDDPIDSSELRLKVKHLCKFMNNYSLGSLSWSWIVRQNSHLPARDLPARVWSLVVHYIWFIFLNFLLARSHHVILYSLQVQYSCPNKSKNSYCSLKYSIMCWHGSSLDNYTIFYNEVFIQRIFLAFFINVDCWFKTKEPEYHKVIHNKINLCKGLKH